MSIPDSLAYKLQLFRECGVIASYKLGLFFDSSWIAVYMGQGVVPKRFDPRLDDVPIPELRRHAASLHAAVGAAADSLPTAADFIAASCLSRYVKS